MPSKKIKKDTKQKKRTTNKHNGILDNNKYWLFTPIQWLTISLFVDNRKSDLIIKDRCETFNITNTTQIKRGQLIFKIPSEQNKVIDFKELKYFREDPNKKGKILESGKILQNSLLFTGLNPSIAKHNKTLYDILIKANKTLKYCIGYIRTSKHSINTELFKDIFNNTENTFSYQYRKLIEFAKEKQYIIYDILVHNGKSAGLLKGSISTYFNISREDFFYFSCGFKIINGKLIYPKNNLFVDNEKNIECIFVASLDRLVRQFHAYELLSTYFKHYNIRIYTERYGRYINSLENDYEMEGLAFESQKEYTAICRRYIERYRDANDEDLSLIDDMNSLDI